MYRVWNVSISIDILASLKFVLIIHIYEPTSPVGDVLILFTNSRVPLGAWIVKELGKINILGKINKVFLFVFADYKYIFY